MPDDISLQILGCGAMTCDRTWLVVEPGRTVNDRSHRHRPTEWVGCTSHAVVVDHPDGRLLWDTSCPRDWEERWAPTGKQEFFPYDRVEEDEYFDSRLDQLGLAPTDFDIVALSHLHFDHAGNAQMFKDAGAQMVCHADELEGARAFPGPHQGAHIKGDYDGLDLTTVRGDTEILEGVTLLETPGHTWGTMSLQVDLPRSGTMIFTSDSIFLRANFGPPTMGPAVVWDNRAWLRSVEKVRSVAERTDATIVFGHDEEQYRTLRLAPEGRYD